MDGKRAPEGHTLLEAPARRWLTKGTGNKAIRNRRRRWNFEAIYPVGIGRRFILSLSHSPIILLVGRNPRSEPCQSPSPHRGLRQDKCASSLRVWGGGSVGAGSGLAGCSRLGDSRRAR